MKYFFLFLVFAVALLTQSVFSQTNTDVKYPFEVKYFPLTLEKQNVKMAYMDIRAEKPNGETAILFHGKNFNGYYWKDVVPS